MSRMRTNTLQTNKFKFKSLHIDRGFPHSSVGKSSACNAGGLGRFLGQGDPLEKDTATHPSILAWRIPWTEESGRLQSTGSQELDTT